MKFQLTALFCAFASASAGRTVKNNKGLIGKARRLEDNQNQDDNEYGFLMNYKYKMLSCKAGESVRDPETGEYEQNAVIFRLCPDNGDCDDESSNGCKEGFGDYVVGLNTFVQAYMEDQGENMQQYDDFDVQEYAECREYENQNDNGNGYAYYVGPACSEDGSDIKLQLYYDEYCTTVPDGISFEDISGGWSMPYSEGGLVSKYCNSCVGYDNGNYELKEMCEQLYQSAGKCETNMESFHYYGKQEGACDYITSLLPVQKSGGGKAVGWIFLILVVGGFAAYTTWWRKRKSSGTNGDGLMA